MKRSFLILLALLCAVAPTANAQKIRQVCRLLNADPMHVEGIGIVVGLNGTGDSAKNAGIMLQKYFAANNFNFSTTDLKLKNIAVVRIEAEIQPFARPGDRIPIRVSSIGDASNLRDGSLKGTSLKFRSEDEQALVWASGRVMVGGTPTIGIVQEGGQVLNGEMLNRTVVDQNGFFRLVLKSPNYMDAMMIENNINKDPKTNPNYQQQTGFSSDGADNTPKVAKAIDAGMVLVRIPDQYMKRKVDYIAAILDGEVPIEAVARIRINRSTGAAVITGNIGIQPGFITYQGRTVTLQDGGENRPPAYTLENDTPRALVDLFGHNESGGSGRRSLQSLVDTLMAMRCTTEDIINILVELKRADAIQADLVVD
ncbi:flagellar P-ring protein [Planctomycetales bacterium]|nr:flagellar P-ring protein [Planctomycetales bacterium]GHV20898.1 flagellar P-ring protein [Planctomycetales bacterium]